MHTSVAENILLWSKNIEKGLRVKFQISGTLQKRNEIFSSAQAMKLQFDTDSNIRESLKLKYNFMFNLILEHFKMRQNQLVNKFDPEGKLSIDLQNKEKEFAKFFEDFFQHLTKEINRDNLQREFISLAWLVEAIPYYLFNEEIDFLKTLGNTPGFLKIMEGQDAKEQEQLQAILDTYAYWYTIMVQILTKDEVSGMLFLIDLRTWGEYAGNLAEGWKLEEVVEKWIDEKLQQHKEIKNKNFEVKVLLDGNDANRNISKRASGDPDFAIKFTSLKDKIQQHFEIKVELQKTRCTLEANSPVRIKTHKFKKSKDRDSFILMFFPNLNKFSLFKAKDFENNPRVMKVEKCSSWGNKTVHCLLREDFEQVGLYDFSDAKAVKKFVDKIFNAKKNMLA